jgi:hypothetical protein
MRQAAERGAERGAREEVGQRLDSMMGDVYGGGSPGPEADGYRKEVTLEVTPEPTAEPPKLKLAGVVRNAGPRTVTYLKVRFCLTDADGIRVASRTDLLAHGLSVGENNSPIDPYGAKRFISALENVPADWADDRLSWTIAEIAIR